MPASTTSAAGGPGLFQSILLVKDVPSRLPVNISSMEQGWLLYRCDRVSSQSLEREDPCVHVSMTKVQRKYDLAQHALAWQRQRIAGWRLAARVDHDELVSVHDTWRYDDFLVVEVSTPALARCLQPIDTLAPRPHVLGPG